MGGSYSSLLIVLGFASAAVILSWLYFRRFQLTRAPIGVFNLIDIAYMVGSIILVPYLYVLLPLWVVSGLLLVGTLSVVYFLWEPVLRIGLAIWLISLLMVGADIWAANYFGTTSNGFFIVNNVVLLTSIVGLTNLWAQSGMGARDVAILGGFLMFYDFTATWVLPLMSDMITRLSGLPFSPMVAWALDDEGSWVGIGLGDLLLASVFALVMRKAFGRQAGIIGMVLALGAIAAIMLLPIKVIFPVMIVLGPLMIIQYLYWLRREGRERTTWQYLQLEPLPPKH